MKNAVWIYAEAGAGQSATTLANQIASEGVTEAGSIASAWTTFVGNVAPAAKTLAYSEADAAKMFSDTAVDEGQTREKFWRIIRQTEAQSITLLSLN